MKPTINLLVIVKSIDGGTGTYVESLSKLSSTTPHYKIKIRFLVLERPSFRKKTLKSVVFLNKKNSYPEKYYFNIKNVSEFLKELFWIKKNTYSFKPDVILSIDLHCNILVEIIKIFCKQSFKSILTTHIHVEETIKKKADIIIRFLLKILVSALYRRASKLIFVSRKLESRFTQYFSLGKKNSSVIYNGVYFQKYKAINLSNQRKNIIVTIARLVNQKDHITLIKSFRIVLRKIPQAKLWIISDGVNRKNLELLSSRFGLNENIVFFGWVSDIHTFLAKSSIFVLSTFREGFGYVLIEAMLHGLPVISTDAPFGPSEIIDKGRYGILTPIGDSVGMAKKIQTLLTNRSLYKKYSICSTKRSTDFSEKTMLKSYFKEIIALR